MATAIPGKPPVRPAAAPSRPAAAAPPRPAPAPAKAALSNTGVFTADQLSPDATNLPPIYEAAVLYAADRYDAAQEILKDHLKTADGKSSLRTWLMLFDFYQLTNNRKEFDALSILFTVKFERSPPVWTESLDSSDPRRKEKRERKDFFPMAPSADGALLAEIDKLESFAKSMGSCRIDFGKLKSMLSEEAELLTMVLQRLRKGKIPLWFNGFDDCIALLKQSINDRTGRPLEECQGYWSLLFELFILEGRLDDYEELGLEYAVAFEMSPPAWEVVLRPTNADGDVAPVGTVRPGNAPVNAAGGFPMKGVVSANNREMLQQLSLHAAAKQEVNIDMSELLRIDFAAAGLFFDTVRAIQQGGKRVILSNLNELVAALLEVFGMAKHAILMRKKTA